MNLDQQSGSPPSLWPPLMRAARYRRANPDPDGLRITRLCRQVERLSWLLLYMETCNHYDQEGCADKLVTLEGAEQEWLEH